MQDHRLTQQGDRIPERFAQKRFADSSSQRLAGHHAAEGAAQRLLRGLRGLRRATRAVVFEARCAVWGWMKGKQKGNTGLIYSFMYVGLFVCFFGGGVSLGQGQLPLFLSLTWNPTGSPFQEENGRPRSTTQLLCWWDDAGWSPVATGTAFSP